MYEAAQDVATTEQARPVISMGRLDLGSTEGWDANTVTHILGVRAFGTQLVSEQVVGRGLRRTSYEPNEAGHSPCLQRPLDTGHASSVRCIDALAVLSDGPGNCLSLVGRRADDFSNELDRLASQHRL